MGGVGLDFFLLRLLLLLKTRKGRVDGSKRRAGHLAVLQSVEQGQVASEDSLLQFVSYKFPR